MNDKIIELRKKVKKELDKDRFEHTKGVMYTAAAMAMAYDYPIEEAMIAGLLHDCAKCMPSNQKVRICKDAHVEISSAEYRNPGLLHAKAGAILAEKKYKIKNQAILHAIKVHTTGEPNMSILDKIIYISDYIEPLRNQAPRLSYIRKLAFDNIDMCVAEILKDTLEYLKSGKNEIDPASLHTYDFYKKYLDI